MSLSDHAVLVRLSVSQWTARRFDKSASIEVERAHGASGAGRFNKLLIDKVHLDPIESAANALRNKHVHMTLPWQDDGTRMLPSSLYMKYTDAVRELRSNFDREVRTFITQYPDLVQAARKRLGTMYHPEDYPRVEDISARFSSTVEFLPVPTADIRIQADAATRKRIEEDVAASVTQALEARQEQAVRHCWERVRELVERVQKQCESAKPVIRDSLMGNLIDLVELLPALNVTNNPQLTAVAGELKHLVVSTGQLRTSPTVRERTAQNADAILAKMQSWGF